MIKISLCMIVKNEEETLGRCLASIAPFMDEIIIVDTGSTDRTIEVASAYTDQIHHFTWIEDFAAARNYAFSLASQDYVMWLDADDVLREQDQAKLQLLKQTLDPAIDSVTMEYHLAVDEYGNITARNRRNRIVKRANQYQWIGKVHEYLEVWGQVLNSDIAVTHVSIHHESDRNLRIYETALASGEAFSPRDLYYYANELRDHQKFDKAIMYYNKFLNTNQGWIEDVLSACGKIADCYHELGDLDLELESVLRSLRYASPRAETCCRLGFHFLQKNDLHSSIHWYKSALQVGSPTSNLGFASPACSTWLPHLQLCVCYDRLGRFKQAYEHNEHAYKYRPQDQRIIYNRKYLRGMIKASKSKKEEHVHCE
ncbi:glycosyltransferase family 2 protein [Paenibacillus sp. N1-5-1-14]|uniref:tetratricopeptide repeat-containing glycosyltransferase family 2 protein n=1 Tax=Paenibacillus radicibacter TaxID=2972488 RepID=UPI002159275F|nr:glycosyltransferase family 2 protein [Paenibacillus radicibacter]MCR8643034.1 glycosyltransferase family 2 protein [Paenibacillus radicibacter]